ncbi:MAG: polyprenyl synthetase family protein, partial [Gemmatimonadota bacterium]|nr:polyprenyl synthetase family protein [Gemmatimonadota bacterium]
MLLRRAWELSGGKADGPPELLLVLIELLHAGSLIIDDIEDDSQIRRGRPALHRLHGLPLALNTGNWLYFLALAVLARSGQSPDVRLALYEDVSMALMRCHQGQALDLSVRVTDLRRAEVSELVATSTRLKTGSLMELAATLGARSAEAPADQVVTMSAFGAELGVALQMLDDWSGIRLEAR